MDAADSWHLIVGNSGRFIFVVASSGFARLVDISEGITTRIECARDKPSTLSDAILTPQIRGSAEEQ